MGKQKDNFYVSYLFQVHLELETVNVGPQSGFCQMVCSHARSLDLFGTCACLIRTFTMHIAADSSEYKLRTLWCSCARNLI